MISFKNIADCAFPDFANDPASVWLWQFDAKRVDRLKGHVHSRVYFEPTRSVAYALAV